MCPFGRFGFEVYYLKTIVACWEGEYKGFCQDLVLGGMVRNSYGSQGAEGEVYQFGVSSTSGRYWNAYLSTLVLDRGGFACYYIPVPNICKAFGCIVVTVSQDQWQRRLYGIAVSFRDYIAWD
ncbi:unnamed protein product [Enterobius vermicularis]|uniref:Jacalin-type lectin domain-containing protein n=1 Tax=Enterobius vermicularis TaxID=51028 RepID=A0A0N4V4D3_ENTVE|nr:unnamed protein product [Enterobius vermicularis]